MRYHFTTLLLFLAISLPLHSQFQNLPGMPEPNPADFQQRKFHLTSTGDTIKLFRNVRTRFTGEITNREFPCRPDGVLAVYGTDCDIQMVNNRRFEIIPSGDGKLYYYALWQERTVPLGWIYIQTIEADTTNPDFLNVHPKWNVPLETPSTWTPDESTIQEDPNLILSLPRAAYQWVHGDAVNKVLATYNDGCNALRELALEAEGYRFEKMDRFNCYKMIPEPERIEKGKMKAKKKKKAAEMEWVDVKLFVLENGQKLYLDEARYPVFYGREPGAMD